MKTFNNARWDIDADNNTFQELFEKSKKKSKTNKKIKKAKEKLKKIDGKVKTNLSTFTSNKLRESDTVKLLKTHNNVKLRKNGKKVKTLQDKWGNDVPKTQKHYLKKNYAHVKNKLENISKYFGNPASVNSDGSQTNTNEKTVKNKDVENNNSLYRNKKKKKKGKGKLYDGSDDIKTFDSHISTTKGSLKENKKFKKRMPEAGNLLDFKDESLTQKLLSSNSSKITKKKQKLFDKLKEVMIPVSKKKPILTLRQKMLNKLKAARFRYINEQIYKADSKEAQKIFQNDPDAFSTYHDGFRKQVESWPINPLDNIINSIKKMPKTHIIADFGCGDARLSKSVTQVVHSFDLVAADETVIACDMSKVPLGDNSVDVVVFCLSLMGTNLKDYLIEANRVLKTGGTLKIAEVESRFENVSDFIKGVQQFGFKNTWQDASHSLFYFMDFHKERNTKKRNKLPVLNLLPCLYKKR